MLLLFSESEKALLNKIAKQNTEELFSWRIPNLIFPLFIVLASLGCYLLFKSEDQRSFIGFANLLINGSLPMFALNRMSSVGINLFRFDKSKEKKASTSTYNLRVKIDEYSKYLIFTVSVMYIFQVIHSPFELSFWIPINIIISIVFIYSALIFSRFSFLLQERLVERTLGDDIKDEAIENKKHLANKYGE